MVQLLKLLAGIKPERPVGYDLYTKVNESPVMFDGLGESGKNTALALQAINKVILKIDEDGILKVFPR